MIQRITRVDYTDAEQAADLVALMQHYAEDPMGGGQALPNAVARTLCARLSEYPNAFSFLTYVNDEPAGLINCFESLSTFSARPLVNIHDLCVKAEFRGMGLGKKLLETVEEEAFNRGCIKVTLEVLSQNNPAQRLYLNQGFQRYELDPRKGQAEFWQKLLD